MSIRRIATITGAAAFVATTLLVGGIAHASDLGTITPADSNISTPHPCEWSTHKQTGNCVTVTMPQQTTKTSGNYYLYCPTSFPYPFLGAFSGNPVWTDATTSPTQTPVTVVRAIAADDSIQADLSYQGSGSSNPGYVTVFTNTSEHHNDDQQPWYPAGRYGCADSYGYW